MRFFDLLRRRRPPSQELWRASLLARRSVSECGRAPAPAAPVPVANPLEGKPLSYLIGSDDDVFAGRDDRITEVPYESYPAERGISVGYCNLFDEKRAGLYGPYLHSSDTARRYDEGQIDPRGPGWRLNLVAQLTRRGAEGFRYIELDNPDAYGMRDVLRAIELAGEYGLKIIAKNPLLMAEEPKPYVAHPNVHGAIVETGAGSPHSMHGLRTSAGKPLLPVWFVAFGDGTSWAASVATAARCYRNMGVTYSTRGEYGNAIDILRPNEGPL